MDDTAGAEDMVGISDAEAAAALGRIPELAAVTGRVRACSPRARTLGLTITQAGRIDAISGDIATAEEQECIEAVLSGVRVRSVPGPTAVRVMFTAQPPAATATNAPPPPTALEPWLADIATRQRDAILACTGRPLVAVRVVVTNQVPQWSLQGELAGSAEEACVRSLVAGEPYPPADGTLVRVIR